MYTSIPIFLQARPDFGFRQAVPDETLELKYTYYSPPYSQLTSCAIKPEPVETVSVGLITKRTPHIF